MIVVIIHSVQKNSQTCWWTVSNSPSHQGTGKPEDCPALLFGYTLLTMIGYTLLTMIVLS